MAERVYDPIVVEQKWQSCWKDNHTNEIDLKAAKNPYYVLMMFPYPSAEGLHVGNVYAFTGADVYARHRRLRGYDVFEPIGFDAFGIHSENFAMKINRHPSELIPSNIANFTRQLSMMGFMFDWRRTVDTTSPEYYKWTQWIFLKLYKAGLAYRDEKEVNFCPECGTVISDEQVNDDGTCERHPGTEVERKVMPCWFFKITDFADRLVDNHDWLDWSERTKKKQVEWVGKSKGAEVDFQVADSTEKIRVYTTRPDTLFGATFMVLAMDHPLVDKISSPDKQEEIVAYRMDRRGTSSNSNKKAPVSDSQKSAAQINKQMEVPSITLSDYKIDEQVLKSIPVDFARENKVIPVDMTAGALTVAVTDSSKFHLLDEVKSITKMEIIPVIASESDIDKAIARYYQAGSSATEKTGVFTGAYATNPVNGQKIPIYISDYVLMGYGTGAIMAVPAHDERDFEFAQKFDLKIIPVINPDLDKIDKITPSNEENRDDYTPENIRQEVLEGKMCWSGPGLAINSSNDEVSLDGLGVDEAKARITAWLESKNLGTPKTTFRLRDWGISRQRYWGPPIPIIYDEEGKAHPVPEDQLPITLPDIKEFRPKGDGRGPLAHVPEWVNVEIDGKKYRRETDVMDNFLDSAWYFLRYISSNDDDQAYDPELIKKWLPVDMYIGGNEHAVLHLMYTRFICMALHQAGVLDMGECSDLKDIGEPFKHFRAHGLIVRDGAKMSKNKGNVINPDEYVERLGADTLRLYLMFLGPYLQGGDFRDKDIQGLRRLLNRLHAWYFENEQPIVEDEKLPKELRVKTHQTIKKVREDIDNLSYNTAIAAIMELFNAARAHNETSVFIRESLIILLAPFAPHFAEEIWCEALGKKESIFASAAYPEYEEAMTKLDEVEIVLQVNGKIKDRVVVDRNASKEDLEKIALANELVQKNLSGRDPKKIIAVPGRLVNVIG